MSKLATSDPTRTADSGHVTAMSLVRWGEMTSYGRRSVGLGRQLILVAGSFEDPIEPSMSKLATSDPTRTAESGHVTHMSSVRWER